MKRYLYILLAAVISMQISAQNIEVIDSADYALVRYSFEMQKPRSAYSLTFTPQICGHSDTLSLSPILVRGRSNEKIVHREYVLSRVKYREPSFIRARQLDEDNVYSDTVRLDSKAYSWVLSDSVTLCVRILQEGCCNAEMLPPLASVASAPVREPLIPVDTMQVAVVDTPVVEPVDTPEVVVPAFKPSFAKIETFEPDSFAAQLVRNNPVAIQYKDYKPYDKTVVLAKDSGALYVHFPLDKVVLLREFSNNAETLDKIMYMIKSLMADTTTEVKVIQIIGLASIEGNVPHNEWLAENRGKALKDYIAERIDTTNIQFEVANGGEAWSEFRWFVQNDRFEGRERVLEIIDTNPDLNARERWLRSLNNGRTWAYMKANLFAPLRNSGYVRVYYNVKPDRNGAIINEGAQLLQEERYEEALQMLLTVSDDMRAQNALGVAYYMTGDTENAIRSWRSAAANGNTDAFNNLQHVLINRQQ